MIISQSLRHLFFLAVQLLPPLFNIYLLLKWFPHSFFMPYVLALMVGIVLLTLASRGQYRPWKAWGRWLTFSFGLTYLLLEVAVYICLSFGIIRTDLQFFFGGLAATDGPLAVYDPAVGYKPASGMVRLLTIHKGQVEFDHRVRVNPQGWFSYRDYLPKKKSARIKRYAVLGDSFSAGMVVDTAWPDAVQARLLDAGNDSVELYNFSLDGVGLANWHRVFFQEIVPNYEFDGLVIAYSAEKSGIPDFDRRFIVSHSTAEYTFYNVIDSVGERLPEVFPLEGAVPAARVFSAISLDLIKQQYASGEWTRGYQFLPIDAWFFKVFYGAADGIYKWFKLIQRSKIYEQEESTYLQRVNEPYSFDFFKARYANAPLLLQMMAYCRQQQKEVVFAAIPDLEHACDYVAGQPLMCRKEGEFLAAQFNAKYVDGFAVFEGKGTDAVEQSFYRYDHHWNKTGMAAFVDLMLSRQVFTHQPHCAQ